jgi:predicted amidohydrolase
MFKLALVQMLVESGNRAKNLAHASEMIARASALGAQVLVLPEAMDLGWTDPSAVSEATPIPEGEVCRFLMREARKNGVYLCSGLTEFCEDKVYNSAVFIDPDGKLLLTHRKLNELEIGHPFYEQGDRLKVCHTDLGSFGVMICADAFARDHVLSRSLGYMGADVILSPCAWAVPADHDNVKESYGDVWRNAYRPVAKEFSLWIVGASNVGKITGGPWRGRKCIGCSLVVNPSGEEVLMGPYGENAEEIIITDIETVGRPARGCGWAAENRS